MKLLYLQNSQHKKQRDDICQMSRKCYVKRGEWMHADPEIILHRLLTVGLGAHILWSCVRGCTVVSSNDFGSILEYLVHHNT